jgi:hypothetical protein
MALGKLHNDGANWYDLEETEYEMLMDENTDDTAESVLLEAREMLHRLENKSHRRGKPERTLRRTQAWG